MKINYILLTGLLVLIFSCTEKKAQESETIVVLVDSVSKVSINKNIVDVQKSDYRNGQDIIDSLKLTEILKEAIDIAIGNKNKKSFNKKYGRTTDDGSHNENSFNVEVEIIFGNIFSNDKKHLLIRRIIPWGAYIDVLLLEGNSFKSLIYREQVSRSYVGDTIIDVNGDKQKDFLVHWYPASGCCRRNIYNVYLYQKEYGTFTKDFKFINPTFSPSENIVRGVGYGHPGSVGLYKYQWIGYQIDTIEYIYPNQDDSLNRTFVRTNSFPYYKKNMKTEKLQTIPNEYHKIESIDWFNDY